MRLFLLGLCLTFSERRLIQRLAQREIDRLEEESEAGGGLLESSSYGNYCRQMMAALRKLQERIKPG